MKTPIIEGFSQAGLQSYLNKRLYNELYWPTLFPVKPVNSLDGKTIIGDQGSRVAAYVIAYDAKTPQASRKAIATQYFDIPKIALSRVKTEREILEHNIAKALRGNDAVLEDYFNDIDFVFDGVQSRKEWLALQAVSLTKLQLTTANNPLGIINETVVDFGMPAANKKCAGVIWASANLATMTPIGDFIDVVKAGREAGIKFARILMHPDAFDLMVRSTEFQTSAKSLVAGQSQLLGYVGLELTNKVLTALNLPEIVLMETSVGVENAAGVITYANPWDANHIVFIPQVNLGSMYVGPIAEEVEKPEGVWQAKKGSVLVSMKKSWDPVSVTTKGESNAFPSWPTIDKCFNLYLGHTSVWA